jgi:iron complex outermembrane receptor protein
MYKPAKAAFVLDRQAGVGWTRSGANALLGCFVASLGLCGNGFSQSAPLMADAHDEGLADIIVTANKRPESLSDVPSSVLAITAEALERTNVQTFDDLVRVAPDFTISKTSQPANNSINIRGIGTYAFSIATQPSVAVIVDDVAQPFQAEAFSALTDVKQVDILRGPQSTLFGKAATAGVVNITTRGPSNTFAADAEITASTDVQESVRASVTGPITETLKFRLSGNFINYRGNLDNVATDRWEDGDVSESWRGHLIWTPNEAWTLTLLPYLYSDHGTCCAQANTFVSPGVTFSKVNLPVSQILDGAAPSPYNTNVSNNINALGDSYDIGSGSKIQRRFERNVTLTNIASYDHYTLHDDQDTDATNFNFASITPGAPTGGSANGGYFTVNSLSEELNLTSAPQDSLRYTTGLYFSKSNSKRDFVRGSDTLGTFGVNAAGVINQSLRTTNSTQYSSWIANSDIKTSAAYGQLDFDLARRLTLTGGLRLHHEDIRYNFLNRFNDIAIGYPDCSQVNPYSMTNPNTPLRAPTCNSSTNLLGKSAIAFHFNPDLMAFADVSQGFKGLAYDVTSTMALQNPIASGPYKGIPIGDVVAAHQPISPEKSVNYEIGFKGEFAERRLTWNLTAFYEEFRGFQAQYRDGLTNQNVLESIGKVTTQGVESELAVRPVPQFTMTLNAVYDVAKMVEFPTGPCYPGQTAVLGCVNGAQSLDGKPLPNAPKESVNVDASYQYALSRGLTAFIDLSYRWQSQVIFALNQDPNSRQADYGILNIASTIAATNWKLTLFCTNVLDQHYAINRMTASQFNISPYVAPFTSATYWTPGRDAFRYGGIKWAVNF